MLRASAESVLDESRIPIILRILDDASTDATETYVRRLMSVDNRVEYVRNDATVGSGPNYLKAFESIETEYFLPLADDDFLAPDFLYEAYRLLGHHRDVAAAVFTAEARENGAIVAQYPDNAESMPEGRLEPRAHLRQWLTNGHYHWSSVLWRSSVLAELGSPYFLLGVPDVDLQAQVFNRHPVVASRRLGSVFRVHDGQVSRDFGPHSPQLFRDLFERLDGAVRAERLFAAQEYADLRDRAMRRYRVTVRNSNFDALAPHERLATAAVAGFELGDWRTAQAILEGEDIPEPAADDWRIRYFPGLSDADEPVRYQFASGGEEAALMHWLTSINRRAAEITPH